MISKKTFYTIIILIIALMAFMWIDILGSEPLSTVLIIGVIYLFFDAIYTMTISNWQYHSEKVIFAEGGTKSSKSITIEKPSHHPIARYKRIFTSKGWRWTFSGYNRGFTSLKGDKAFFAPEVMTSIVGQTLIMLGEMRQISHAQFYDYIDKDKELYKTVIGGNNRLKVFIPDVLTKEKYRGMLSDVGDKPFGTDQFKDAINWMKKRTEPNKASYDELDDMIVESLKLPEKAFRGMKLVSMEANEGKQEGITQPSRSHSDQEF